MSRRIAILLLALASPLTAFGAQDCKGVKEQIRFMRDADQSIRLLMAQDQTNAKRGATMEIIDRTNTTRMKKIIADCGWPTISAIGAGAADAAWLIAQHADRDPAFQRRVLTLMEPLVARGEADPVNLAYLTDRVAVAADQPQRYGTQFIVETDGTLTPKRCDDLAEVDARRAALGLPPLATYLTESRRLMDLWAHPERAQVGDEAK